MPMRVREVIQLLEKNSWRGTAGKELAPGTLNAILKKAGLK